MGGQPHISIERLHEVLELRDGKLFWRPRQNINKRLWGERAFTTVNTGGYYAGQIDGRKQYAHRVIYAMHYGRWPRGEIDHINHDKLDNRPENLRDVSPSINQRNLPRRARNTSGHTGVYWNARLKKWAAQIKFDGATTHLGTFAAKVDAIKARASAAEVMGFHPNHGS